MTIFLIFVIAMIGHVYLSAPLNNFILVDCTAGIEQPLKI